MVLQSYLVGLGSASWMLKRLRCGFRIHDREAYRGGAGPIKHNRTGVRLEAVGPSRFALGARLTEAPRSVLTRRLSELFTATNSLCAKSPPVDDRRRAPEPTHVFRRFSDADEASRARRSARSPPHAPGLIASNRQTPPLERADVTRASGGRIASSSSLARAGLLAARKKESSAAPRCRGSWS